MKQKIYISRPAQLLHKLNEKLQLGPLNLSLHVPLALHP